MKIEEAICDYCRGKRDVTSAEFDEADDGHWNKEYAVHNL